MYITVEIGDMVSNPIRSDPRRVVRDYTWRHDDGRHVTERDDIYTQDTNVTVIMLEYV